MIKLMALFCTCIVLAGCSINQKSKQAFFPAALNLSPQDTIERFFDRQYHGYTQLQNQNIDDLLDLSLMQNRNEIVWLNTLIQRRKLIAKNGLCFVDTNHYPYTITFDKIPKDERMEFLETNRVPEHDITIHFTITGKKGTVYPPFLAMNAQHTMRLKQVNGSWVITDHFFPGSEKKFGFPAELSLPSEKEMLRAIKQEFQIPFLQSVAEQNPAPSEAVLYHGTRAAEYANSHMESTNPAFYRISDWMGNCSNFTSQCILNGFCGERQSAQDFMTPEWFAGIGGGSPAWENVEHFWEYATAEKDAGLTGEVVNSILQLKPGGLIQVRTKCSENSSEKYNHSLLLADTETLTLAQNTPDCFLYYSDLVFTDIRFFNPKYLTGTA